MKKYSYDENVVVTKKLIGDYDSSSHIIIIDDDTRDILMELEDFDGLEVEVSIKVKKCTDLTRE